MSENCKYIIFDNGLSSEPVFFSTAVEHAAMAKALRGLLGQPVSAGFIGWDNSDVGFSAFGTSYSLNLKSRPEDTEIIARKMGVLQFLSEFS